MKLTIDVFADILLELSWIPSVFGRKEGKWTVWSSSTTLTSWRQTFKRNCYSWIKEEDLGGEESEVPKLDIC